LSISSSVLTDPNSCKRVSFNENELSSFSLQCEQKLIYPSCPKRIEKENNSQNESIKTNVVIQGQLFLTKFWN
jgi:hypothetical protein